jgi:hypothetical protein
MTHMLERIEDTWMILLQDTNLQHVSDPAAGGRGGGRERRSNAIESIVLLLHAMLVYDGFEKEERGEEKKGGEEERVQIGLGGLMSVARSIKRMLRGSGRG